MYFSSLHGPRGRGLLALAQRRADRVQARHELAVLAEHVQRTLPMRVMIRIETATYGESVSSTPISAIGEPAGPWRRGRRTACDRAIAALESPSSGSRASPSGPPVVGRPGVLLGLGADERAVLDARNVARIAARQIRVRTLGLARAACNVRRRRAPGTDGRTPRQSRRPVDRRGLRERRHLLHPESELAVLRRRPSVSVWCSSATSTAVGAAAIQALRPWAATEHRHGELPLQHANFRALATTPSRPGRALPPGALLTLLLAVAGSARFRAWLARSNLVLRQRRRRAHGRHAPCGPGWPGAPRVGAAALAVTLLVGGDRRDVPPGSSSRSRRSRRRQAAPRRPPLGLLSARPPRPDGRVRPHARAARA